MNASLNEKLGTVKWGEFKLIDVFTVKNTSNILAYNIIEGSGTVPYLCASSENNAVSTYIDYDKKYLEKGNCIFIGGKTFVVTYQEEDFYSNDSHNLALYLKEGTKSKNVFLYTASCIYKSLCSKYSWGNSISRAKIQDDVVTFPITDNGVIDFDFMESFIAELEAERVAELAAYLTVSGLDNYELSSDEENALKNYQSLKWDTYNLEKLFGKSTRGKRLKGDDRIAGTLPFVTAGEASEGISAYISNDVEVFEKNTTTIDMPETLPDDISNSIIKLMNTLELTFGGVDLAFSDGQYYFIEVNPTGEWGWLNQYCAIPLEKVIVDELVGEE